jgi:predicted XRE-type DNA-binding protein
LGGSCVSEKIDAGHQIPETRNRLGERPLKAIEGVTVMKKEPLELIRGSGNVYRDFNMPDADVRQLKAVLAAEIIKKPDKDGVSVRKAQSLTGIDAGDFSRVRSADFRRISVERLMAMINGLGSRVEVKVKVRRGTLAEHTAA